ncbi:MAG: hypothetical protein J6I40_02845, partial [Mailhella sp.]|nr:hypothetical protein [Mailhella sp.]
SLLGTTPKLIEAGLPDEAFAALDGDDKSAVTILKKRNKAERGVRRQGLLADEYARAVHAIHALAAPIDFDAMPSDTLAQIEAKEAAFLDYQASESFRKKKKVCDMWCAAFVTRKRDEGGNTLGITQNTIRDFCLGRPLPEELDRQIEDVASKYRFLHWNIAFPEVAAKGGFDVMAGNPPWERIKIQEKEWFAARVPAIANAPNAAGRKRMILALKQEDPALYDAFLSDLRVSAGASHILRNSGRYPLCGCGDINMYAVFAENMRNAVNSRGRVGCIVPSGIATDDTTKLFFQDMVVTKSLVSLFDFENRMKIFPGIDSRIKFSLLTAGSGEKPIADKAEFVFFAHSAGDLDDQEKRFTLSPDDIAQMNPNTLTCPIFRSRKDAELTKAVYRRVPVLIREEKKNAVGNVVRDELNPWGIQFNRMFDMSNDSALFRTYDQLLQAGGELHGNRFAVERDFLLQTETGPLDVAAGEWLPLYEAKMVHHYNHRWATYDGLDVCDVSTEQLADPEFSVQPRYWVHQDHVQRQLDNMGWNHGWLMGWRDITNSTNERTVIANTIPATAVGDKFLLIFSQTMPEQLLALLNSFASDYFARQKFGGTSLKFYLFRQLTVLTPETFLQSISWLGTPTIADFVRPRVLELTYNAWDMKPFAEELGNDGDPYIWDEERRFALRCELDALFFHLYLPANADGSWKKAENETPQEFAALKDAFPTPRDAVDYIMDTFPIRKKKDIAEFGIYRTKDEILRVYDAMQVAMAAGSTFNTPLFS